MFHLFNKVYIDYDFRFNTFNDFIIASDALSDVTYGLTKGRPHAIYNSYENLISKEFNNDTDQFWRYLLTQPDKLVIYVNRNTYINLQIEYWSSIFSSVSIKFLYDLYTMHVKGAHIKSLYLADPTRGSSRASFATVVLLSLKRFKLLASKVTASKVLKTELKIQNIGFEYLLADYLADNESQYRSATFDRIEYFSWKVLAQQYEELRGELFNVIFDLPKMFPQSGLSLEALSNGINIEDVLSSNKTFSWMVDKDFNPGNIDYIKQNHRFAVAKQLVEVLSIPKDQLTPMETIVDRVMDKYDGEIYRKVDKYTENPTMSDYDNPYEQELHDNLNNVALYGCPYADAITSREQMNIILLSYIWFSAKEEPKTLNQFKLKR